MGPAQGTQSTPGPSFSVGLRPGSILHMFVPSLVAAVQMPAEPAEAGCREGEASLGGFVCGGPPANAGSVPAWREEEGWEGGGGLRGRRGAGREGGREGLTLDSPCLGSCACFITSIYYFSNLKIRVKQDEVHFRPRPGVMGFSFPIWPRPPRIQGELRERHTTFQVTGPREGMVCYGSCIFPEAFLERFLVQCPLHPYEVLSPTLSTLPVGFQSFSSMIHLRICRNTEDFFFVF